MWQNELIDNLKYYVYYRWRQFSWIWLLVLVQIVMMLLWHKNKLLYHMYYTYEVTYWVTKRSGLTKEVFSFLTFSILFSCCSFVASWHPCLPSWYQMSSHLVPQSFYHILEKEIAIFAKTVFGSNNSISRKVSSPFPISCWRQAVFANMPTTCIFLHVIVLFGKLEHFPDAILLCQQCCSPDNTGVQ